MKNLSIILLLSIAAFARCHAAETPASAEADDAQPVASKITEVTVYADRAQVTRVALVNLPAETIRLTFAKLPGWLDEGSVRVGLVPADAGQILDVQVRRTYLARASDQEFQNAEAAVGEISDQTAALDDEKGVLEAQSKQVDGIRMFALDKLPKDMATREVKPAEYGQAVDFIVESLRKIAAAKRDIEKRRRELQPELTARQRKLEELRQRAQLEQRSVVVTVQGAAKPATLSLSYLLPGATWEPVHELRAAPDAKVINLASYAVVMQTSGEDWTGVALSLSTQKSTETMKIPELEALIVGGLKLPRLLAGGRNSFQEASKNWEAQNLFWSDLVNPDQARQEEFRRNRAAQLSNVKRVEQLFDTLQQRGTTAHFPALGAQTVRSDGRPVRVPLSQVELAAQPRLIAAPEMSLNAARTVALTNTTKQPLLPGRVSLFLGGAFLGLTETEFAAPGEDFSLYLGVADQVKLTRTLDKKRSALIRGGAKTRMQVSFIVAIENLSDQALALQLTDRVPVSETDEVRITGVKIQPDGKPDTKGLLHWDLNLAAKQAKEFRIEYVLEYPTSLLAARRPERLEAPALMEMAPPAPFATGLLDQIRFLERKF
jgi:uncharacterized protein (TIGR02231 family)